MGVDLTAWQEFARLRHIHRPGHIRRDRAADALPLRLLKVFDPPVDYYEPTATQWESDMLDLRERLFKAFGIVVVVTIVGTVGFSIIDPSAGLVRTFFMTVITLTTVGYGEEIAIDTDPARIFTAVLILVGMGAVLYFVSTVTAFLLEGQLGHAFRRRKMERDLASLEGHMIVCGAGPTAMYAAAKLAVVARPVVLVAHTASGAEEAAQPTLGGSRHFGRTADSRRISSERRSSPRRDGRRRIQAGSIDSERRASDRRMDRPVRSEMDRRVGDRRLMVERRMTAFA